MSENTRTHKKTVCVHVSGGQMQTGKHWPTQKHTKRSFIQEKQKKAISSSAGRRSGRSVWQHTAQGSSFLGWALQLEKKKLGWLGEAPPPNRWKRQIMHKNKMGRLFKVFLADCWVRKPTVKHVRNILSSFVGQTTFCVWLDGKSTVTDGFLSCNNVPTAAPRAWVPFP